MQKNNISIALVEQALKSDKKIVLDADALWAAQKNIELLKRSETTILTPHIKEMSDLTGIHVSTILSNPFEVARDFSKEYPSCVLILKSSQTYIAPSRQCLCFRCTKCRSGKRRQWGYFMWYCRCDAWTVQR